LRRALPLRGISPRRRPDAIAVLHLRFALATPTAAPRIVIRIARLWQRISADCTTQRARSAAAAAPSNRARLMHSM